MSRTFGYDEFGRLNSSVTGGYDSFKANYNPQQDEFGNVKNASYHYWQNSNAAVSFSATYQNNRVVPNTVTDSGQAQTWNYDAMGNRTSVVSTINGTPTTVESINIDAVGRGVAAGATLDGEGQTAAFQGNYFIRSTIFGGEILTTVDLSGSKTKGRILDGASLLAEQIQYSNGQSVVWHHRDPLNLVARDAEAGQVKRRVFAITPNGAQVETNEGVNMATYYPCLFANNTPSCTGYNPQAIAGYGAAVNQINGLLGSGIKVDGALTLASLSDIARQNQRTGNGSILFSTALFGTPIGASIGFTAGSWQKRQVWTDIDTGNPLDVRSQDDSYYEWVPGGEGISGYVQDTVQQIRDKIAALARQYVGSQNWLQRVEKSGVPAGQNKCNTFVNDVIVEAGGIAPRVPYRNNGGIKGALKTLFTRPPNASEWGNINIEIPGWEIVKNKTPRPGDVVAVSRADGTGHVGIYITVDQLRNGRAVASANAHQTPQGIITDTAWGFRANDEDSKNIIIRRYIGTSLPNPWPVGVAKEEFCDLQ